MIINLRTIFKLNICKCKQNQSQPIFLFVTFNNLYIIPNWGINCYFFPKQDVNIYYVYLSTTPKCRFSLSLKIGFANVIFFPHFTKLFVKKT